MPSETSAPRRWLADIRYNILLARSFVEAVHVEAFEVDTLRIYAVTRCREIISEASRRLPEDLRRRHPGIAWKEMAGAGNIYRHEYEDVAPRRLWRTVQHDLLELLDVVDQELALPGKDR